MRGQVYLSGQEPKNCLTCQADLNRKAVEI